MILSIPNKNSNRNKNSNCGTTAVFADSIDGYARNTHIYTYTDTHSHIHVCFHSESSITLPVGRERSGRQTYINPNLKPHTQAIKLKPIPTLPLLPPFHSLFSHIFSDCFLGLSWIICSPLCVSLFCHKAFCNWIMTSKSVWHLLLFFL